MSGAHSQPVRAMRWLFSWAKWFGRLGRGREGEGEGSSCMNAAGGGGFGGFRVGKVGLDKVGDVR